MSLRRCLPLFALLALAAPFGLDATASTTTTSYAATGSLVDGPRGEHDTVVLLDGRVLVVDGLGTTSGYPRGSYEVYTPSTGAWSLVATSTTGRRLAATTLLVDGRVLVSGGADGPPVYSSTELWDPASPSVITAGAPMGTARFTHLQVRLADGRVLAAGGSSSGSSPTPGTSAEIYNPASNTWSATGSLVVARNNARAVLLESGKVLVVGGDGGAGGGYLGLASCELYDPVAGTFSSTGSMSSPRSDHDVVRLLDGRVLAVGGNANATGSAILTAEIYDPATGTWSSAGTLSTGGQTPASAILADGRVVVSGGRTATNPLATAEVFDPVTQAFSVLPNMSIGRQSHSMAALPDGRVLIVGGLISPFVAPHFTAACELLTLASPNAAPTANAGPDQSAHAGDLVTLDGTASLDDNTAVGDLEFAWTLVSQPSGSTAVLSGAGSSAPTFTADLPGTYRVALVVTDDCGVDSTADEVEVSSTNVPPTADAGADVTAAVGELVTLAGAAVDPEGDAMTYAWVIVSRPAASTAILTGADTLSPSFTPDEPGSYEFSLVASDPFDDSAADTVVLTAVVQGDSVEDLLLDAAALVRSLPRDAFAAIGHRLAIFAQIRIALAFVQECDGAACPRAIRMIQHLMERTDGYPLRGALDVRGPGKDWVVSESAQEELYDLLSAALDLLLP